MTTLEIYLNHTNGNFSRLPYIHEEAIEYKCDGKEGYITFDGYYYVEDHAPPYPEDEKLVIWERPQRQPEWLPQILSMTVKLREKEHYDIVVNSQGWTEYKYKILEESAYIIEIYKREILESTDKYSSVDDGNGEDIEVCFFPTNKQTIYFKVLETLIPLKKY